MIDIEPVTENQEFECNIEDRLEEKGCGVGCCMYVFYILLVTVYVFIRAYAITAHSDWRATIVDFPEACAEWT